jgi:hypothetical protein
LAGNLPRRIATVCHLQFDSTRGWQRVETSPFEVDLRSKSANRSCEKGRQLLSCSAQFAHRLMREGPAAARPSLVQGIRHSACDSLTRGDTSDVALCFFTGIDCRMMDGFSSPLPVQTNFSLATLYPWMCYRLYTLAWIDGWV